MAALQLGRIRTDSALELLDTTLTSNEYRVRKAAALALANFPESDAGSRLRRIIAEEQHADVVAVAIVSLAKVDPGLDPKVLRGLLDRDSWSDEIRLACLRACEQLGDAGLVPIIKKYARETIAIEESSGQNLDWFFADWVTGGGHPTLEVKYDYLPNHRQIVLSVEQVQPFVEGQRLFSLPVTVTIAGGAAKIF